jgi:hypothetical protein
MIDQFKGKVGRDWNMLETLHCDHFHIDGDDLVCEMGDQVVRRIPRMEFSAGAILLRDHTASA